MNNTTFYSFFNSCLEEEFKILFIMRRESLHDYVLIQSIKEELYSTSWDKEHYIIGEPQDSSFPIIEIIENKVKIIERYSDSFNANSLAFQLDSMKI